MAEGLVKRLRSLVKVGAACQAVNQIVGSGDALHGRRKAIRLKDITRCNLDGALPGATLQAGGIAYETADPVTQFQQAGNKTPADVSCGARDQNKRAAVDFDCHFLSTVILYPLSFCTRWWVYRAAVGLRGGRG